MTTALVLAFQAETRQYFFSALTQAGYSAYRAKDAAEALLHLVAFEIDTVILVDEGEFHDIQVVARVLHKRFNHKKLIMISPNFRPDGFLLYSSVESFFESLS